MGTRPFYEFDRPTKDIHIPDPVTIDEALAAQARSPVHTFNTLPDCFFLWHEEGTR